MIKNINALEAKVKQLELEVAGLKNEKDLLTGLCMELEERVTKLETEAFNAFVEESVEELAEVEEKVGGTEVDDD